MEYPIEKFQELAKFLNSIALSPEVDIDYYFPDIRSTIENPESSYPYVIVSYLGEDGEGPSKIIEFKENYWNMSLEALKGSIMHTIKSLMEELQSFEGE